MDSNGRDRAISYTSKKLTAAEENYTASKRDLLARISLLQRFRCYVEGSTFEVLTDNQILKHLLTKKSLNRREPRWMDTIASSIIREINLVRGNIHVLGDSFSRVPNRLCIEQVQCRTPSFLGRCRFFAIMKRTSNLGLLCPL